MPRSMDELCHQELQLLAELCARGALEHDSCQDFIYHLWDCTRPQLHHPDISVSLLTPVVAACGLSLFGVSLFMSWKLSWIPWQERGLFSGSKDNNQEPLNHMDKETNEQENSEDFIDPPFPDSFMKISHTSRDIPLSTQAGIQESCAHGACKQCQDNEDLGELMFSLCYLPMAGRIIITIIKARDLKAMDLTGVSDPYVKVSLMCEGRELKKRKTTTKGNRLHPIYNEIIVFDVPPENIDQIHSSIAVGDYVGHNEIISVCQVGNEAERLGRVHWSEILSYPRKSMAHWHSLVEKNDYG
ncbi:Synaptotagmin-9 [Heterocephalus glaber]|uniref:Synaptotagmin-9 n=1 Tax=Heterocephalus glaber TaxID=10181 RepID=G5C126_HETGA|nr:Synaptotagmin-9 [Heterocephalus glaber]